VLELAAAATGTFGDEGPQVLRAVDALELAVARWDLAIDALATAARAAPADRLQQLELAHAYLRRGRAVEALAVVDTALALAADDPALYRQRGLTLESLDRPDEATRAFHRAWTLGSRDGITTSLAFARPGADAAAEIASVERAFSASYEQCLGARTLRQQMSRGLLDETGSDAPLLPPSIYARAYGHLTRREFAEAIAEFRRAVAADPLVTDPAASLPELSAATLALRRGELAAAQRHLEAVRAASPDSSEVHRILGLTFLVAGERAGALEHLNTAIRLNPANERARIAMARVLVDAGRGADAERLLRETLVAVPESRLAHWWLGWVHEQADRLDEARQHLMRASGPETLAGRHRTLSAIARLARVQGDFAAIVPAFEQAVLAAPDDVLTRKELAFALLEQDRPVEAFRELVAACAMAPSDPDVHALVGRIHLDADRAEAAAPALRRALELAPAHADARYALATVLLRLGDEAGAAREREIFDRASRASIDARRRQMAVDVLAGEAAVRTAEGFHDRAVALWQRVIEAEPDRVPHLLNLAAAQVGAGRTLEAIQTYERIARADGSADVYRRLAELYAQVGRHDDSRRASLMSDSARQTTERGGGH
jgi:tetratricopeptide (TPR) repeat protein